MIAPVCRYPGSKHNLAPWIISHFPPHDSYVEPYMGSAAVFLNKPPAKLSTLNDINGHVVNLFRVLRDQPEELAALVAMTPWAREEYEATYDRDLAILDPLEAARRFLVRTWQGHGSSADQCRNGWRVVRSLENAPNVVPYRQWHRLPERVITATERLKNTQIECRPALDIIRAFSQAGCEEAPRGNKRLTLLYIDPPYLSSTRSSGRRGRKIYDHEMTGADHLELLDVLEDFHDMVVLSGYPSPLYDERLIHWRRVSAMATTEKGGRREEVLWINPKASEALERRLF